MNDLTAFMISYGIIIIGGFILINFLTKGFVLTYLRVKASRFSKLMARIHTRVDTYYKVAKVQDNVVAWPKRGGGRGHSDIPAEGGPGLEMGIIVADIDEQSGSIMSRSFHAVSGHNVEKFDNILVRALEGPKMLDKKTETLKLLLSIAAVGLAAYTLYTVWGIQETLNTMQAAKGVI